ncbi:GDSL esterase/lipase At5g14450-like [Punica granatum]|uniref:GDSL esterase/lipase At5g14450-like n=1 Tax=Punica granatum TaxID=22663 RepID=A0A6P8E6A7_PUNGR|nr:GDSL esterase/lipase At5g14450-like [Punica granatum]
MDWGRAVGAARRWRPHFSLRSFLGGAALAVLLISAFSTFFSPRSPGTAGRSRPQSGGRCSFPAIFNFGDSNSDTGGKSAAFHRLPSPNGDTFFGKPSGRYCDGKVILDFIAEKLGLPYLSAYLDSIGANFRHGANFATGGSTIEPLDTRIFQGGFSPISLDIQLLQFEQFKARTLELHREGSSYAETNLPIPEDFGNALYTMDVGQNDLHSALGSMTEKKVLELIPNITMEFGRSVEKLYQQGARAFWIHNTGPIGCLPYSLVFYPPEPNNVDRNGCIESHNKISREFNRQLEDQVAKLRVQLQDAKLNFIDIYLAKYSLISDAKKHGFVDPLTYCCGHYGDYRVQCGKKAVVNGTEIFGTPCEDPLKVISWDAVHYSHAANKWVAEQILDGSLSDIHVPVAESCPGRASP